MFLTSPLILSLCGVVRERLLPCRVVGWMDCIVYTDYVYPAFVPLLANISCLLFFFSESVFVLFFFFPLFHHAFFKYFLIFFISGLLAISYPLVSLPD